MSIQVRSAVAGHYWGSYFKGGSSLNFRSYTPPLFISNKQSKLFWSISMDSLRLKTSGLLFCTNNSCDIGADALDTGAVTRLMPVLWGGTRNSSIHPCRCAFLPLCCITTPPLEVWRGSLNYIVKSVTLLLVEVVCHHLMFFKTLLGQFRLKHPSLKSFPSLVWFSTELPSSSPFMQMFKDGFYWMADVLPVLVRRLRSGHRIHSMHRRGNPSKQWFGKVPSFHYTDLGYCTSQDPKLVCFENHQGDLTNVPCSLRFMLFKFPLVPSRWWPVDFWTQRTRC